METNTPEPADVLNLSKLRPHLPGTPRVTAIEVEPYVDHTGEDALRVMVVLGPKTPERDRSWTRLAPIERLIRDRLLAAGINLFPYIRYVKRSEMKHGWVA